MSDDIETVSRDLADAERERDELRGIVRAIRDWADQSIVDGTGVCANAILAEIGDVDLGDDHA